MGKKKKKDKKEKKPRIEDATPEAYEFEFHPAGTLSLADCDLSATENDEDAYEEELKELQKKLYERQIRLFQMQRRAVLVFEGWDAAGKGGAIKRLTSLMDPRGYKVWPIAAPRDAERRHHYLWRFWNRLPEHGELAVFDRSWYGRVLVERVEGFAEKQAWQRSYDEINAFERMLTSDGVVLRKFFVHIDKETQLRRFKDRETDPVKNYKIGEEDWRNREKWEMYEALVHRMVALTSTDIAPWTLVESEDKYFARIKVLKTILGRLEAAL